MAELSYTRSFILQSSHFNGKKEYDTYYKLLDSDNPDVESVSISDILDLIASIHGHNFRIIVTVSVGSHLDGEGFAVDDEELEKVVREYDRTNISVHHDFAYFRRRATTERMAERLAEKIADHFDPGQEHIQNVFVSVHETDEIFACASLDWAPSTIGGGRQ